MNTKEGSVKFILIFFVAVVALSYFGITATTLKEAPAVGAVFQLFFDFFAT